MSQMEPLRATHVSEGTVSQVVLKRTKQSRAFRDGNQLVFTRAIQAADLNTRTGDLVQISVDNGDISAPVCLGYGVYNPDSLYKVRFLCHRYLQPALYQSIQSHPSNAMPLILHHHLKFALSSRQTLGLPNEDTDTYRLVHGEGDSLSGLAMDVIANRVVVVMSSAAWCQIHQAAIVEAVQQVLPGLEVVWRETPSRLQQDGYHDTLEATDETAADCPVLSRENGIVFQTFPWQSGQKTGVYCDQRENRWNLAKLCRDKTVLDLCCYHGGFSLNALVHGMATHSTGVDSSQDAIDICLENARLNNCEDRADFVRADITTFLQDTSGEREYDVVVLDPPKLAPNVSGLDKARRKYHSFNRDAIKLVNSRHGGLLLTCTCSAAMTQKDGGQYFLGMVQGAALAAGRQVTLLRVSGAAPCHTQSPISWPAGAYLTAALFRVHPKE